MVAGYFIDSLEVLRPYLIGGIVTTFVLYGAYLYLDRNYKKHLYCAACKKKTFSVHQDVQLSDVEVQQRLERLQYRVRTGQVTEEV